MYLWLTSLRVISVWLNCSHCNLTETHSSMPNWWLGHLFQFVTVSVFVHLVHCLKCSLTGHCCRFGHPFELPLLVQSFVMISTMLSMVRLCVSVHHKSDIIAAKPITFTGEIYLKHSVSVQQKYNGQAWFGWSMWVYVTIFLLDGHCQIFSD